jgi:hypothetical protein
MRRHSFFGLTTALLLQSLAQASIYTQPVSLAEPFGQTPYAVSNAFLREESFSPNVRYWQPTQPNLLGTVTYKFDVPFVIETAQLSLGITAYTIGSDFNFDSGAETYLDVSVDNATWTTVASQTPSNAVFSGIAGPWDISSIVAGSDTVYVRSRLFMTTNFSGFGTSQFLREGAPYAGGYLTASAAAVPESSSLAVWAIGLLGVTVWLTRRKAIG